MVFRYIYYSVKALGLAFALFFVLMLVFLYFGFSEVEEITNDFHATLVPEKFLGDVMLPESNVRFISLETGNDDRAQCLRITKKNKADAPYRIHTFDPTSDSNNRMEDKSIRLNEIMPQLVDTVLRNPPCTRLKIYIHSPYVPFYTGIISIGLADSGKIKSVKSPIFID
ncbi:MAG: hypothetical protein HQL50_07395 [Magnetococcales bacterium]|nr:hypothetical protein [Magnetococcales bacterium]